MVCACAAGRYRRRRAEQAAKEPCGSQKSPRKSPINELPAAARYRRRRAEQAAKKQAMQPMHAVSLGSGGVVPQMMMNDYGAAGGFRVVV